MSFCGKPWLFCSYEIAVKNRTLRTFVQVDRLEDELYQEQEKLKAIADELEQTFAEMSGY